MTTKHTPGPWKVFNAWNPAGNVIAFTRIGSDEQNVIRSEHTNTDIYANNEADLRLIAAAPELLEACKQTQYKLIDFIHEIIENDMIVPLWVNNLKDEIDSVIKKATGK